MPSNSPGTTRRRRSTTSQYVPRNDVADLLAVLLTGAAVGLLEFRSGVESWVDRGDVMHSPHHEWAPESTAVQCSLPVPEGASSVAASMSVKVAVSMSVKVAVSILSISGPVNRPSGPPLGVYR
jgi:hypothetical protein